MAEPKWTDVSDVVDAWIGDRVELPETVITKWICRAERKLAREIPRLEERIASGTEPGLKERVGDAVAEMVETKLRNPEGYRTIQDTTGPMSGGATFGGDNPGGLVVTDEIRKSLAPPEITGGAFSIDMARDNPAEHPLAHAWVNGPVRMAPGDGSADA